MRNVRYAALLFCLTLLSISEAKSVSHNTDSLEREPSKSDNKDIFEQPINSEAVERSDVDNTGHRSNKLSLAYAEPESAVPQVRPSTFSKQEEQESELQNQPVNSQSVAKANQDLQEQEEIQKRGQTHTLASKTYHYSEIFPAIETINCPVNEQLPLPHDMKPKQWLQKLLADSRRISFTLAEPHEVSWIMQTICNMDIRRINILGEIGVAEYIFLDFLFQNNAKAAELRNENFEDAGRELYGLVQNIKKSGLQKLNNILSDKLRYLTQKKTCTEIFSRKKLGSDFNILDIWINIQKTRDKKRIDDLLSLSCRENYSHLSSSSLSLMDQDELWAYTVVRKFEHDQ